MELRDALTQITEIRLQTGADGGLPGVTERCRWPIFGRRCSYSRR